MIANTMSSALPEALRSDVDQRVKSGDYGNTSEYLRELIRRDQEDQAKKRLRKLIEDGLNSGLGRAVTTEFAKELKDRALGGLRGSPQGSVQMPRTT
jgi:antitoxin ParD1/3/4